MTQGEYEKVMGVNPSAFADKQMDASAFKPPLTGNTRKKGRNRQESGWQGHQPSSRGNGVVGRCGGVLPQAFGVACGAQPQDESIGCRPKRNGNMPAGRERRPVGTAATTRRDW